MPTNTNQNKQTEITEEFHDHHRFGRTGRRHRTRHHHCFASKLPEGVQLLCVGTNAMATAAMLKAGAQRGATGENAVRWAAKNADILLAPIALVLKDSMMGEITGDMAASVGSSSAVRILIPTERCGTHVAGAQSMNMQTLVEDAARQAAAIAGQSGFRS